MKHTAVLMPTRDELTDLLRAPSDEVVSLLLPPTPTEEARITLRNLARAAATVLEGRGMRAAAAREMLAPVDQLMTTAHDLWSTPTASLSLYLAEGWSHRTRGPGLGSARATVAPQAQVKHLLDAMVPPAYCVVALSRKTSRLYRGGEAGLQEVKEHGLPVTWDDVLRFDDRETQLQSHGAGRSGAGRVVSAFHGQGGEKDVDEDLLRYLRVVATRIDAALQDELLVIAATDELAAAFRRHTGYGFVVEGQIAGSGERLSVAELEAAARPRVEEVLLERRRAALGRIEESTGVGRATLELGEVAASACEGRVDTLVVAGDREVWGSYDAVNRLVAHAGADEAADDVLNLAAVEVWRHGGEVFVVRADEVPGPGPAAALLRY